MNLINKKGERDGYWAQYWEDHQGIKTSIKLRYIWKGKYNNGTPCGLFQYFTFTEKLHRKEFYL